MRVKEVCPGLVVGLDRRRAGSRLRPSSKGDILVQGDVAMLTPILLVAAVLGQGDVPPVPGLCSAPVPTDRETPGCYQTSQIDLGDVRSELYWQIYQFPTEAVATAEAARHRWSTIARAHSRFWLYVLGGVSEPVRGGFKRATIGPLYPPAGPVTAHFSEAIFPPGMKTRVHSHPGPEAFYVVEGSSVWRRPLTSGASRLVAPM